ncbi:MAG: GNAT family N-acetyltransferase [Odoribacter sp.]|nr:GNAT family N-acetyltransferase [Odoribacter sp.]
MIQLRRITQSVDRDLQLSLSLYREAFPEEERRSEDQLLRLVDEKEEMVFNAVETEEGLAGLFVYWEFEDFYYLEHLAIYPELRNRKIGQQLLEYVRNCFKSACALEVEPPFNEMAERRIAYYRRNGFEVLEKEYEQPSYDGIKRGIPLWIMSNCRDMALVKAIDIIREEVYRKNY